jgi:hypothetical protein
MSGSFENPNASKIPYVNFSNRQLKRPKIYIRDMTDILSPEIKTFRMSCFVFFISFIILRVRGSWCLTPLSTILNNFKVFGNLDRRGCDRMVVGFTTTCAISSLSPLMLSIKAS